MQFQVKTIETSKINEELKKIGFDETYLDKAALKHEFLTLKIQNLPPYTATIIKETALSKGTDAAVHRDVLTHKIPCSDLILSGSIKQLEEIAKSLCNQPFSLSKIAESIEAEIKLRKKETSPLIMGVLNLTQDSFSDGGKFIEPNLAIAHAKTLIEDGADIIDIGAESTRPNAKAVDFDIEIKRIMPVLKEIKNLGVLVSIDTRNSKTAKWALDFGADIINDVSGFNYDTNMPDVIKDSDSDIVIMHSKGTPETMDNLATYDNLADDIFNSLSEKIEFAINKGIKKEKIIIDVGFGFAKNIEQNYELLKKIKEFNSLGVRNLAGTSRKRFLKNIVKSEDNKLLDEITMLSSFYLIENKIDILRVHNVKKTKFALDFYNSICLQTSYQ